MSLPQELEFGPHRLKLLTVSRNADDVADARRCSDHALTAFCFVGEVQDSTHGASGSIVWYYSPLYQFERKKIRVEESVIVAALTKGVAERDAGLNSRHVFVDAASDAAASPEAPAVGDDAAAAGEKTRRSSLPALFIRLGKSTTFREYRLIVAELEDATAAASMPTPEGEMSRQSSQAERSVFTPPVLSPMLPRKPSLKPLSSRYGSFSVRRPPIRREGLNNFMIAAAACSAPNLGEDTVGSASVSSTAPAALHGSLSPFTVASTTAGDGEVISVPLVEAAGGSSRSSISHVRSHSSSGSVYHHNSSTNTDNGVGEKDDGVEDEVRSVVSTATAPVVPHSPRGPSSVPPVLHSLTTPLHPTPDPSGRKGMLNGGGSSLSSAFLSTSNVVSGRVSRLPTSAMSTARSPGAESDMRPVSSHGATGVSARCTDDIPHLAREPLLLSSAASTPEAQSPAGPTPPSQPAPSRLRTPRRPPLRANMGRAQSGKAVPSSYGSGREHASEAPAAADQVRAATPPAMHVR